VAPATATGPTAASPGAASPTAASASSTGGYLLEQLEPSAPPPPGSAARILADATAEAERIRERTRAQGHQEGRAQGHTDGIAETRAAAEALHNALAGLQQQAAQIAHAVERDAVELALELAAKILAGALDVQPERVLDTVAGALRRIADRRRIAVLVDPADLEVVNAAITELQTRAGGIELCEIQADRRVGRGGAIVRTLESEVDATVQTQLERAREVIRAELGCEDLDRGAHSDPDHSDPDHSTSSHSDPDHGDPDHSTSDHSSSDRGTSDHSDTDADCIELPA
jgi:flagellar assembly protein FliH